VLGCAACQLERDGHTTSAADLACEDQDAGAEHYADSVVRSIPASVEHVALVGHSLAGLTIPVVAERRTAVITIYLCALLPVPGKSFDEQHADITTGFEPSEKPVRHPDRSSSWSERGAIEVFYQDCEPATATAAARRLRRQFWRVTEEVTPLLRWPPIPSAYILCADDRAVSPEYGRRACQELLAVEAVEMAGGHSPFLSRPRELAAVLQRVAAVPTQESHG
jgi:pimeloyl-ACP methyl ester carboxylesterase